MRRGAAIRCTTWKAAMTAEEAPRPTRKANGQPPPEAGSAPPPSVAATKATLWTPNDATLPPAVVGLIGSTGHRAQHHVAPVADDVTDCELH